MTQSAEKPPYSVGESGRVHVPLSQEKDETRRLIRDLFALGSLPAMWTGAEPRRIGESLLAAVDTTVRPALGYFRLTLDLEGEAPQTIELAHVEHQPAQATLATDLGERIVQWAATHGADELLLLPDSFLGKPLRVWIHPLGHDVHRGVLAAGFAAGCGPSDMDRMLLNMGAMQAIVACNNAVLQQQAEAARQEAQALHDVTRALAAELDLQAIVQKTVDAARELTGAKFTAFFYNVTNEGGELYTLYALSGAERDAFDRFGTPRNTPLFEPTFRGTHVVRLQDVLHDPRYGTQAPHYGMPKGHLPVRSYLAVPVISRSGEVLGGLFFGHPEPAVFGERAERIAIAIARQAAVGIDNARLFAKAEAEIRQRERAEGTLRASEERYRRLAQLLPVAVYTCEAPSGRITYFNDRAVEAWGRAPGIGDGAERFCGSLKLRLPDGTALPHDACPMAVALREGREFRNEEVVIERPDGSRITALVNIDPTLDESGKVVGAINVFHDVTAHKRAEQALREQKENLETLLETLPVGVFIAHDPDCRRIVGNRAASELLRMPPGANLSKSAPAAEQPPHFRLLKNGQAVPAEALPVQRAARGEVVQAEELDHEFDDGTLVHALISARPLYDPDGRPRGAVASILDITSLKKAEGALREADRRKDEFLATLAHELRNPLAPVRTSLDLMKEAKGDARVFDTARDAIERQVDHLVRLVDDLLDVSRISRDRLELRKERIALAPVVRQAVDACRPLAESEEQRIEIELPRTPIHLHADPVRLAQVFGNLINNACKYTPARGTIRVTASRDGHLARVSVEDNGVGIPADQLEGVFDMFAQVGHSLARSRGGLGIGLTLVKRLVEMHEGSVVAESAGIGHGSRFVVRLPAIEEGEERRERSVAAASEPLARRRILVVDDNRDAAELLAMLLELSGHELRLAYDGLQALDQAEQFRPDVVLLDIGLPGLSGLEVCQRIRQFAWGKQMVIVALSGWGQESDRQKTRQAGFDGHLIKPVDQKVLSDLLRSLPTVPPR